MKTFDEKDLITWSNREKAVIGNEYYFADCLDSMKRNIKRERVGKLTDINNNKINATFNTTFSGISYLFACILPIDAVKEEKKYRACKTIKEFYELISNSQYNMSNEDCIYRLIRDFIIHIRNKNTHREYYSSIISIGISKEVYIEISMHNMFFFFDEFFEKYEIKINGEWQPFGVLDENIQD